MNKRAILTSSILGLIYVTVLCCCGIFGTGIASWFLSWVTVVLKVLAVLTGFAIVVFLPVRIEHALATRKERRKQLIDSLKLDRLELEQKKQDKIAKITAEVNKYE